MSYFHYFVNPYLIIFTVIWAGISYNVLDWRRSSPHYKANRRFAVGWNVGEGGVGMERSGM